MASIAVLSQLVMGLGLLTVSRMRRRDLTGFPCAT